jgi:hypothetical protein
MEEHRITAFELDPGELSECFQFSEEGIYNYYGLAQTNSKKKRFSEKSKSKAKNESKGKGTKELDFSGTIIVQVSADPSSISISETKSDASKISLKSKGSPNEGKFRLKGQKSIVEQDLSAFSKIIFGVIGVVTMVLGVIAIA